MRLAPNRTILLVLSAALVAAALPTTTAGTSSAPEMPDQTGDVDPLSLVGLKPQELEEVQGNASMYDIRHAYVTAENPTGFWFVVNVVDLDGGLASTPTPVPLPVPPPTPPIIATFDVHFTVAEESWIARATLEPQYHLDTTQQPPVAWAWFATNFTLHKDDLDQTLVTQLFGTASPLHEAVVLFVPKMQIGSPEPGATMEGLYAVSKANAQVLDHAPDAMLDPTAADPNDPLRTGLSPGHGEIYEFGQYPGSGAPAKLELSANGETTRSAKTGETIELALSLKNLGEKELEVRVGAITPRGWTSTLDPTALTLPGGSSEAIIIRATPGENAGANGILKVTATTSYETQTVVYVLQHADAAGASGSSSSKTGGGNGGAGSPGQSLSGSDSEDSPGLGSVAAVGVLGALALVRSRRR